MKDFWFFIPATALFDSFSTALQIVIGVLLLSTSRPKRNFWAYFLGLTGAYLACGLIFLTNVEGFNAFLAHFVPNFSKTPDSDYYTLQGLLGLALLIIGPWIFYRQLTRKTPGIEHRLGYLVKNIPPAGALILGAGFSTLGFPMSIPYIGALEKLHSAEIPGLIIPGVLLYNLIYVIPVLIPFGVWLILSLRRPGLKDKLKEHTITGSQWLNLGAFVLMGALFLADSGAYWITGHPLLGSKFL